MDDPIADIPEVIYSLTTATPYTQQRTLERYFTPTASFTHPFCAVTGNRQAILRIFQWYKILSPHISIQINSIGTYILPAAQKADSSADETTTAYDETHLLLYVNLSQTFAIWFIPFRSPVTLTTVLQLERGANLNLPAPPPGGTRPPSSTPKFYITSQNDLYQVDQFVRFFAPWGVGTTLVAFWHWIATLFCIIGATVLQPVQWVFAEVSRPAAGGINGQVEAGRRVVGEMMGRERKPDGVVERYGSRDGTSNGEHGGVEHRGGKRISEYLDDLEETGKHG